jgi:prepilin-type N-terminal cleavage/methylation domain-containing protein
MLMASHLPAPLTAEKGLTLVELLVAMLVALVVSAGALGLLEVTLHQESQITDHVRSDQIGRLAMTTIMDELHSSCTGFGATAIQGPGSTPTSPLASTGPLDLWFLTAYGNPSSANAVLSGVAEHEIHWAPTGTSNTGEPLGTLTDYSFASNGGSAPNWTFPVLTIANAQPHRLASNVVAPKLAGVPTIFQYYKYSNSGTAVELTAGELATATANQEVAKVTVSFTQAPDDGDTRAGRLTSLSDSAVLRFNSTVNSSLSQNTPCA